MLKPGDSKAQDEFSLFLIDCKNAVRYMVWEFLNTQKT